MPSPEKGPSRSQTRSATRRSGVPTPQQTEPHAAPDMQFIVSTGPQKTNPQTRKLIRSHVMLGKNRGKSRRPKGGTSADSTSPETSNSNGSSDSAPDGPLIELCRSMVPARVGSDLSFTQFADNIEPATFGDILKFSFIAKKVLFPLYLCIDFEKKHGGWFEPLTFDAAYLHAMIFTSQAYYALVEGRKVYSTTEGSSPHLLKTIRLLRERLLTGDESTQTSDMTVAVVLALAMHANISCDYVSARHHMEGLRRIVDLRGGLGIFRSNDKLMVEIIRCDIGMVLHTGQEAFFSRDLLYPGPPPTSCRDQLLSLLPASRTASNDRSEAETFLNEVDERLVEAWDTMKLFIKSVNFATRAKRRLPKAVLLDPMATVMYPLLEMSFDSGTLDEAVRLGILAYASHIFLQWHNVKHPYQHFPSLYRSCLGGLRSLSGFTPQLLVWILMVGALSAFTEADDAWLKPFLRTNLMLCDVGSWTQMRDILESFMWVRLVQDKDGKAVYDSLDD